MAFTSPTNYACTLLKPMTIEIRDIPMPLVGPDDVLVQVYSTGICGSDLHNYTHGGVGKNLITEPLVIGHESAGIIVQVGEAVTRIAVGERVAIEPTMFCHTCHNCKAGKTNICRNVRQASMSPTQGTLAQYYACPSEYIVKLPDSISWEIAGCIQPLAVAVQLAKRAGFAEGKSIAVFGCGPLGCLVMAVAQAYGASKILAFDILPKRVGFAKNHWADYATVSLKMLEGESYEDWAQRFKLDALEAAGLDTWGVDIAVEASGVEPCMHAGMTFLHPGGTYVQAGLGHSVTTFPTLQIVAKELDLVGTVRYTAGCFQAAIDLLSSGKVDLKSMVTAVFPLAKSVEALEAVRKGDALKVVIMNQEMS
ncbi:GroES-like protein [Mycena floridula]|nr:GroES-like protein [Mycena floridula]